MKFHGRTVRSLIDPDSPQHFAPWVRALRGKSGVYLIVQENEAQYVGVSYSSKLYGTLTRHVQDWNRRKSKAYTGPVFDRSSILVAVEVIEDPREAQRREREWIHRFGPILNRQELPFETKRMRADADTVIEDESDALAYLADGAAIDDEMSAFAFFDSLSQR